MTKDKTVSFWIFNAPIWVGIAGISNFIKKKIECSPYYSGYCGNLLLHLDNADGAEEAEEKAQERASEEQTRAETSAKR